MKEPMTLPVCALYKDIHENINQTGDKSIGSFDTEAQAHYACVAINNHERVILALKRANAVIEMLSTKSTKLTSLERSQLICQQATSKEILAELT